MRNIGWALLWVTGVAIGQIDLQLTQVSDLRGVVDIKHAGDGSGRLFFVTQAGQVHVFQNGTLRDQLFLDLQGDISLGNERGLLSIGFPPDHAETRRFYVWYTDPEGFTVLARMRTGTDPNVADESTLEIVLRLFQPFANHNGGRIEFGPDGYLYLSIGDGGSGGDPEGNGQDPSTLLGSIVRLDVSPAEGFAIPPDNPFVGHATAREEIWAYGLRNPWRIAFDRMTGDLWIADVGQNEREEINLQPAASAGGENYGWNIMEGTRCFAGDCNTTGLTPPIFEYSHDLGCSITGGQVYRGLDYPRLQGLYFYGDFCGRQIWGLRAGASVQNTLLAQTDLNITTFGEDEVGNIYVSGAGSGIFLISDGEPVAASRPIVGQHSGTWVVAGLPDQGFFINVGEDGSGPFLFFAWFTFLDGEPFWLVGNQAYAEGDASVVVAVQRLEGPNFLDFSAANATRTEIGTMAFTAVSCDAFTVDYDLGELGAGRLDLQRLTGTKDFACVE